MTCLPKAALLLLSLPLASSLTLQPRAVPLLRSSAALAPSARHVPAPTMGVMDFIRKLFYSDESSKARTGAGSTALNRLRVVLAADRTGLDELTMEKIRNEIKEVIAKYFAAPPSPRLPRPARASPTAPPTSPPPPFRPTSPRAPPLSASRSPPTRHLSHRYVVIDEAGLQFDLVADDQLTLVTASFPVRPRTDAQEPVPSKLAVRTGHVAHAPPAGSLARCAHSRLSTSSLRRRRRRAANDRGAGVRHPLWAAG